MKSVLAILGTLLSLSTFANLNCQSNQGELRVDSNDIYLSYTVNGRGATLGYDDKATEGIFYKVQRGYCTPLSCLSASTINSYSVIVVDQSEEVVVASHIEIPSKGKRLSKKKIINAIKEGKYDLQGEVEFSKCD